MESHQDGDDTKRSVHSSEQDYIEARKASRSVRTAGPKDLTVTVHNNRNLRRSKSLRGYSAESAASSGHLQVRVA